MKEKELIVLLIILIISLTKSYFIIYDNDVVFLQQLGNTEQIENSGFHFKIPFIANVTYFSTSIQSTSLPLFTLYEFTGMEGVLDVKVEIVYSIPKNDIPKLFYATTGGNYDFSQVINRVLNDIKLKHLTPNDIILDKSQTELSEIENQIKILSINAFKEQFGVTLNIYSVRIEKFLTHHRSRQMGELPLVYDTRIKELFKHSSKTQKINNN